jgi:hypothetical protein
MKIKTVSYGFTKPTGVFANDKVMIEIEISDTDDEMKALRLAKETADKFFKECNPLLFTTEPTITEELVSVKDKPQSMEDKFIFLVKNATSITELKMYEKTANNPQYPHLMTEYSNRLRELFD